MAQDLSKLVSYAVLNDVGENLSKLVGYVVLTTDITYVLHETVTAVDVIDVSFFASGLLESGTATDTIDALFLEGTDFFLFESTIARDYIDASFTPPSGSNIIRASQVVMEVLMPPGGGYKPFVQINT